ncbi:MAG TPA: M28 family peptidase [Blastocatellia bacterium]|nr:M28 family peptidase [Blastocatellia bacterium]
MSTGVDLNRKTAIARLLVLSFALTAGCHGQSTRVAADRNPTSSDKTKECDAARAYDHVKRLVALGPHASGSEAIKKAQAFIEAELKSYGLSVSADEFNAATPRGPVPMKNIIGELRGEKPDIVLITGHYDTKLQDGFVGANDGGSSTAAVLETARVLSKSKPEYTLWFVLFDGEEAIVDWNAMGGRDNTYGSRHLAAKLKADGTLKGVKALVLFDMIGDRELDIKREGESTPWLVDAIWKTARSLGYQRHFLDSEQFISDDHLPFRDAGVPVVDLIDFNYGPQHSYWHTNLDTLDHVSGESIKIVGDVVIRSLPEIFKRLNANPGTGR